MLFDLSHFFSETGAARWLLGGFYEAYLSWQLPWTELCTKLALFQLFSDYLYFFYMCGNEPVDSYSDSFDCCHDRIVNSYNQTAYVNRCADGSSTFFDQQDPGNYVGRPVLCTVSYIYWKIKCNRTSLTIRIIILFRHLYDRHWPYGRSFPYLSYSAA